MEELRSTDILDKEIQDDARKKASKILAKADEQASFVLQDVENRIAIAKKEREEFYLEKIEKYKSDLDSSLPLEKSRFLVSYISSSVAQAINDYLCKLPSEKRIEVVLSMLKRFSSLIEGKTFDAVFYGFDLELVNKEISKIQNLKIEKITKVDFSKTKEEAIESIDIHEGIILTSTDASVKIRLTLEEYITELVDKYKKELAVTLFGGRLPE